MVEYADILLAVLRPATATNLLSPKVVSLQLAILEIFEPVQVIASRDQAAPACTAEDCMATNMVLPLMLPKDTEFQLPTLGMFLMVQVAPSVELAAAANVATHPTAANLPSPPSA